MNSFLLGLFFQVVQRLVGGDFFEIVKSLVLAAASSDYVDIPGGLSANEQRKQAVKAQLKLLQGDLGDKAQTMGGWLLSAAVDAAVGYLKGKNIIK